MIEFLTDNWKLIVIVGCIFIDLILVLVFKKRPELIDNSITLHLISWILAAEAKFKNGEDKKKFVLTEAKKYLGDKYSERDVSNLIEYLLTVPEKKEKSK